MITELLKSINEQLEELNSMLKDSDYLKDLENKIEIINKSINREHQENLLLKQRIDKAIEYITEKMEIDENPTICGEEETITILPHWLNLCGEEIDELKGILRGDSNEI